LAKFNLKNPRRPFRQSLPFRFIYIRSNTKHLKKVNQIIFVLFFLTIFSLFSAPRLTFAQNTSPKTESDQEQEKLQISLTLKEQVWLKMHQVITPGDR